MVKAKFNFPKGFMWGTSTASHQVEGSNANNNWYAWEQSGHVANHQTSGLACDWWGGRWREDFDRAVETGQNAHRLSIEWSRIQPDLNRWNEDAIDYYRQMLRGLLERGITPMVTLHYFSEPLWVSELGGWKNQTTIEHFQKYVSKTVAALHEYVNLWCTINEPMTLATKAFLTGDFPPGNKNLLVTYQVIVNLILAHSIAYQTIHDIQSNARVGFAHQYRGFLPLTRKSPLDQINAKFLSRAFNDTVPNTLKDGVLRFLGSRKKIKSAKATQDFFGINYYTHETTGFRVRTPGNFFSSLTTTPNTQLNSNGDRANEPGGFFQALKWAKQFNLPILITENGTEDPEDDVRSTYLAEHIHQLWHAVNFNWKIQGYFHQTLVDNFAWDQGWTRQFGLWQLNPMTQERQKRPSADFFAAICKENSLSSEMVATYAPNSFNKLFPN